MPVPVGRQLGHEDRTLGIVKTPGTNLSSGLVDGHRLQVTNTTPHTPKVIQTVVWPTHRPPTIGELMWLNVCPIDLFHPLGGNLPREPKERLAVGECPV